MLKTIGAFLTLLFTTVSTTSLELEEPVIETTMTEEKEIQSVEESTRVEKAVERLPEDPRRFTVSQFRKMLVLRIELQKDEFKAGKFNDERAKIKDAFDYYYRFDSSLKTYKLVQTALFYKSGTTFYLTNQKKIVVLYTGTAKELKFDSQVREILPFAINNVKTEKLIIPVKVTRLFKESLNKQVDDIELFGAGELRTLKAFEELARDVIIVRK